jgi:tol-pal system protein YbgF
MERSSVRRWALSMLTAALVIGVTLPAHSQGGGPDSAALQQRIEFLERQVRYLSQQVVGGTGSGGPAPVAPAPGAGPSGDPAAARLSGRLDQLEQDLRSVTGRLDQVTFRVQQVNEKLDRLTADLDYRLGDSATPPAGSSKRSDAPSPAVPERSDAATAAAGAAAAGAAAGGAGSAAAADRGKPGPGSGPRVLGTMTPEEFERNRPALPAQGESPQPADGPAEDSQRAAAQEARAAPAAATPREQYSAGFDLMQKGRNAEARSAFEGFLKRNPDNALAPNARYWLGETYYAEGDYSDAATTFLDGYEKNKTGPKAPETLLKLGLSLSKLDKKREACATFKELDRAFPNASDAVKGPAAAEKKRLGCG